MRYEPTDPAIEALHPKSTVSLNLIVIRSSNLQKSERFYQAIGLQFIQEQHGNGPIHLVAKVGGTVFEIYPRGKGNDSTMTRLGFGVESLTAVISALEAIEVPVSHPPFQDQFGLRAVFIDPDGHKVEITQIDSIR